MIDDIRERGIEQGIERGIEQGIERGIEQGIERGTFELIKRMLRKGRTPESIAYDTDIPIERIMEISEQL
jgi:predicted transposase/invertase (TIGR01784 family)